MKNEKRKKIILIILIVVGFIISFIGGLTFKSFNTIGVSNRFGTINQRQYENSVTTEYNLNGSVPILYTDSYSGPNGQIYDANSSLTTADGGKLNYQVNYSYVEGRGTQIILTHQFYILTNPFPFGYYTYDYVPEYYQQALDNGTHTWSIDNVPMDTNYYNLYFDIEIFQRETNYELIFFHITPIYYGRDMTGTRPPEESYYIYQTLPFYEFYIDTSDIVSQRGYGDIANSQYSLLSGFTPDTLFMLPVYEMYKIGFDYREVVEGPDKEAIFQEGYYEGYNDGLLQYERNNALGPVFKLFADASRVVFDVLNVEIFSGITIGTIVLFPLIAFLIGWILKIFFGG